MSKTYSFKKGDPQNKRKSRQTRAATSQTMDCLTSAPMGPNRVIC